jgi:uncharacterized protein
MTALVECELAQIMIAEQRVSQVIVLREKGGARILPIEIGIFEAMAINRSISGEEVLRPLTHDLLASVIQNLGGTLQRVLVHDLVENPEGGGTFLGVLVVERSGQTVDIDCRPSDGVALAVRVGCPIYVGDHLLEAVHE